MLFDFRPELEDERERLVLTTCAFQKALQETEEQILKTLASAQGNILESEDAINVLEETKVIFYNLFSYLKVNDHFLVNNIIKIISANFALIKQVFENSYE